MLASLALGVGLLVGSFAWWGFTLERTVGDADRADEVVDVLLDERGVQDGLADATETAMRRALPADVVVSLPADQIEAVARGALAGPEAQAALRGAMLGVHGYVTGALDAPPVITAGPIDQAVRQQLVTLRPDLAPTVAALPPLAISLPDQGLEAARTSREALADLVRWAAVVGSVALAVALVVSPRRSSVLRKMGWWALITGGLWLVLRFAVPPLAESLLPAGSALVGGLATAVSESMLWPGLILVALGNVLFLGGSLIDWAARQQHARRGPPHQEDLGWSSHAGVPPGWDQPWEPAGRAGATPTAVMPRVATAEPTAAWEPATTVAPGSAVVTGVGSAASPVAGGEPTGAVAPIASVAPVAPGRWVEGRGYVTEDVTIVDRG